MNTIGRYQLLEKLGQGGMGVVYRAMDPLLQRVVAVKLIAAMEPGSDVRERFFREARAAGQLSHKNIITIHDLGEHEGQPYLAMEFLQGQDLQQRMAGQAPMTLARKLELAIEICEGIEYAHDHGVIHRDIKPANIFLTTSGVAKILDFGLARLITSELTNSNMMMGTLNYMAPEQVRGERADHRSDVFSTGVVLYELLGGRKAFEGDSFGATLYKILEEVPEPLRNIDANLPPELVAIVERALEKPRDARYPHMSDMLRDLTGYRQHLMMTNSPVPGASHAGVTRLPLDAPEIAHDAPTFSLPATPLPARPGSGTAQTSGSQASGSPASDSQASAAPGSQGPRSAVTPLRHPAVLASVVAVLALVGAYAFWTATRSSTPTPRSTAATADTSAIATQQKIARELEQASRALQAGDEAAAQRHADAVLAISPGHAEARRLRDRAQQASESVSRGISNARELLQSGRVDEAMRAAGEVLAVDPESAEGRRVMDEAVARSRGKGTEEARSRMAAAKRAAASASAPTLASASYAAAVSAERDGSNLYKRGRLAEAMAKFWEASGLFRSAEIAAQTEAAVRAERARLAAAAPKPADTAPADASASRPSTKPAAPTAEIPSPPITPAPATGLPLPPPVAPPSAPPAPATKPPAETPPPPSPTAGINELLDRYKRALESRNLESIKRLWPGIDRAQESAIRYEFQNTKSIEVEIVNPQITVTGTSATVQFIRRYRLHTVDGQRPETETRTTMSLHRNGTAWTIDQIRFDPVR
jgi:serine/threonine protein kinase